MPLYDRAVAVQPASLVERELELDAVGRLLADASRGSGGTVVFEGPAGIGKSSLLAAARSSATDLRVLSAHGGELERELPFGIVRQLLESVVVAAGADELESLLAGAAALARPVLFSAERETRAEPSFSALHGLYWLTVNLADERPLLLAVDDLHWADIDSLRWFVYLARRLAGVPLALVLTTRPSETGPAQELLDELLLIPEVAVLQPGGLSAQAIAMLARERLGEEPDPSFVTACRQATGGNPFLLNELLGEFGRRDIAPSRDNAGLAGQLSSQGVGRAVRARLRRLPPTSTALARAVAVIGDSAGLSLAGDLAGLDDETALSAARALADATIFEPGQLAFIHPLVRAAVYAELPARTPAASQRPSGDQTSIWPPPMGMGRTASATRRLPVASPATISSGRAPTVSVQNEMSLPSTERVTPKILPEALISVLELPVSGSMASNSAPVATISWPLPSRRLGCDAIAKAPITSAKSNSARRSSWATAGSGRGQASGLKTNQPERRGCAATLAPIWLMNSGGGTTSRPGASARSMAASVSTKPLTGLPSPICFPAHAEPRRVAI